MIDWSEIETVMLDMDGTLLDLSFDNYFWRSVVPEYYGHQKNVSFDEAVAHLEPIFKAQEGLLNWYCLDYWTRELGINIAQLKADTQAHIKVLPDTRGFLAQLQQMSKRCILVTNAHVDSLSIKMQKTGLIEFFDAIVSSHDMGYPKEQQGFWQAFQKLESFDNATTVMVDDSLSVLRAADVFGIKHLVAITQPDSTEPPRLVIEYTAVGSIGELFPN
jgi:putative hydrolase of the HAD superfamily